MIIDHENLVSKNQAITATANSEHVVDLGPNSYRGNSVGDDIKAPFFFSISEAFAAAGAATLTIAVVSSDSADLSSPKTHQTATYAKADLTVGTIANSFHVPHDAKRYLGVVYTVATGPFTAGKITMGVSTDRQTNG
jgi:hypothetical protein